MASRAGEFHAKCAGHHENSDPGRPPKRTAMPSISGIRQAGNITFRNLTRSRPSVREPVLPVIGVTLQRHDGDDPHLLRLIEKKHGIGEIARQVTPHAAVDPSKAVRRRTNLRDKTFDLIVETPISA